MHKKRSEIGAIANAYLQELSKLEIKTNQVILYGSFAKGNFREDSDIDLLIVSDSFKRKNLRRRLEILGIAAARIMQPIEAYGVTPHEIESPQKVSFFLKEILNSGVVLKIK